MLPSHTRRSEESQALQQFSTPLALGLVASAAAAITPADLVLEPSAGTGLLAIFAELAGGHLVLNELAATRAGLLGQLFQNISVTRYDAAHIHDHLDAAVRPTVVLMNPPFSAAAHVEGRVADAALRHVGSALARLTEGGRLVAITGETLSPHNPAWRDGFIRLQERGRVVFTAGVDGRVYARHGTTTDTRLTVIDRVPADDPKAFPASIGMAPDSATLLDWVTRLVPPRPAVAAPSTGSVVKTPNAPRPASAGAFQSRPGCSPSGRRAGSVRLASNSPTRRSTGLPRRPAASPRRCMRAMRCSRSAFPARYRIRPASCSRPPWRRWRRPSPATGRICRPR